MKVIHTSGTRKTAVARATLRPGNGIIRINSGLLQNITSDMIKLKIQEPLLIAEEASKAVDISININGGGKTSQAEAARLAIARALAIYDKKLQKEFLDYDRSLLVADVRRKETHRPNTHGKARARRQRSKR
jgi:small subunit ribosomal protein S9